MGAIFGIAGQYTDEDIRRMIDGIRRRGASPPVIHRYENGFLAVVPSTAVHEMNCSVTSSGAAVIDGYLDRSHRLADLLTDPASFPADCAGLYACAVYDAGSAQIHLYRDPSGARPLYFARFRDGFVFASSPGAIVNLPEFPRRLNPSGISLYLSMICPPDPVTIFESIEMLRPGFMLTGGPGGFKIARFHVPVQADSACSPARSAEALRTALEHAIIDAIPADTANTGFFLSGGTDTGAVVALAAKAGIGPINTFTIGYEGTGAGYDDYNEFQYARLIADRYGTKHNECRISPETIKKALPGIIAGLDQPSGDAINTYLVAGTLPASIHTVLTGTGGDEVFIGSHWFRQQARLQRMHRRWERIPAPIRRLALVVSGIAGGSASKRLHRLDALNAGVPAQYCHFKLLFDGPALDHLLTPDFRSSGDPVMTARSIVDMYDRDQADADDINRMESLLFHHEVSNLQLRDVDSMSLAHGIEARSPLVDRRVLDVLDAVPGHCKAPGGQLRHLMFAALDDCLMMETRTRKKMSFIVPMDLWARRELRPAIERLLAPDVVRKRGILNPEAVQLEKDAFFLTGKERHPFKIWNLALLELWCRVHIDTPVGTTPPGSLDELL